MAACFNRRLPIVEQVEPGAGRQLAYHGQTGQQEQEQEQAAATDGGAPRPTLLAGVWLARSGT